MCYYIAETQNGRPNQNQWRALRVTVTTLRGAKVAAQRGRTFQGTIAWVGEKAANGKVVPVARRNPSGQVLAGWEAL